MRRIVDAFSENEKHLIGARTKAALGVKARRGERVGRYATYGYRLDENGAQIKDMHEREGIGIMVRLRREGLSYARIAAELETRGLVARGGQRLLAKVIRDIVRGGGEPVAQSGPRH